MAMDMRVVGFKPPDENWKALKAIWDECEAAGNIEAPKEAKDLFYMEDQDSPGPKISIDVLKSVGALRDWEGDGAYGYEIDVHKLPPELNVLRFYCSW
jgi:hypothetical protein